jgi:hypothetical protein
MNDVDKINAAIILLESVEQQTNSLLLAKKLLDGHLLNLTENKRRN